MEKVSVYDQIVIKTQRNERWTSKIFYTNFHLKDDLRMEFIVQYNEIIQWERLHHLHFIT